MAAVIVTSAVLIHRCSELGLGALTFQNYNPTEPTERGCIGLLSDWKVVFLVSQL